MATGERLLFSEQACCLPMLAAAVRVPAVAVVAPASASLSPLLRLCQCPALQEIMDCAWGYTENKVRLADHSKTQCSLPAQHSHPGVCRRATVDWPRVHSTTSRMQGASGWRATSRTGVRALAPALPGMSVLTISCHTSARDLY